jgi:hypothetical protein
MASTRGPCDCGMELGGLEPRFLGAINGQACGPSVWLRSRRSPGPDRPPTLEAHYPVCRAHARSRVTIS